MTTQAIQGTLRKANLIGQYAATQEQQAFADWQQLGGRMFGGQMKHLIQVLSDALLGNTQRFLAVGPQHKIIHIADIGAWSQSLQNKMVQVRKVQICEMLAGEVAYGKPKSILTAMIHNAFQTKQKGLVLEMPSNKAQ